MPEPAEERPAVVPQHAGRVLLPIARVAIARELGLVLPADTSARWLQDQGACFVTLRTGGALHGCIGTVVARRSLLADVAGNARAAAFRDRRFTPLTAAELDDTVIEVSVLSPLEPLQPTDQPTALARLRPGTDGVVLDCGGRRATFLPQVWATLPDPETFLARLKVKAGFAPEFWSPEVRLSRYTVAQFHEEG
jgi:hypothetical protein